MLGNSYRLTLHLLRTLVEVVQINAQQYNVQVWGNGCTCYLLIQHWVCKLIFQLRKTNNKLQTQKRFKQQREQNLPTDLYPTKMMINKGIFITSPFLHSISWDLQNGSGSLKSVWTCKGSVEVTIISSHNSKISLNSPPPPPPPPPTHSSFCQGQKL